jgi:SAM-dependent methyltransferase
MTRCNGESDDVVRARQSFEQTFGVAGRLRCRAIELADRVFDGLRKWFPGRRLFYPLTLDKQGPPLPAWEGPALVPGQPVSPITARLPDRLLFSAPDTSGGDRGGARRPLHQVYYDSAGGVAMAYPPVELGRLAEMYAARPTGQDAPVVAPGSSVASPYAGYRGGLLGRLGVIDLLARVPSPWWWFRRPVFDDNDIAATEVLRLLRGGHAPARDDPAVRFLNVGCFDGAVLDRIKSATRWQTFGAETNPPAAAAARAKGHTVWEAAPLDLALALPVGESFRVIFLANTIEHLQNPLLVLRRLRLLLEPGGLIVLNQPNLDSAHATLFGPTWGRWQLPYHRTLTGRRGLRRMAALSDLRVVRLRTRTDPYPTCASVQLNELGLGGIVPDGARFSNEVAARGVRLAGWSRLLWDWRGRGDFLYAVLRAL